MAVETIISNDYVTLKYDSEGRIVHHEFHKFVFGEPFRTALWRGAEVMKERKATKWLSDDRENAALPAPDAQWAQTEWFPAVKAAGWKHWAVVMPAKVTGQLNMKQWIETYSKLGINARMFNDPVEAKTWLKAQI